MPAAAAPVARISNPIGDVSRGSAICKPSKPIVTGIILFAISPISPPANDAAMLRPISPITDALAAVPTDCIGVLPVVALGALSLAAAVFMAAWMFVVPVVMTPLNLLRALRIDPFD